MGGSGSGARWSKKGTVEQCYSIDTADLKRWRMLAPCAGERAGSFTWGRGGNPNAAAIDYRITVGATAGALRLLYAVGAQKTACDYTVRLVTTPCRLGGVRWWFVCPLTKDGRVCGRRVRKLYLSGRYFGCRCCHNLSYRSTQESDSRVQRLARYEAETIAAAMDEVEVPPLPAPPDPVPPLFPKPPQPTREDQLGTLREELRTARRDLAEVSPARDFFASEPAGDAVAPFAVAESILEAARMRAETAEHLRSDPPEFEKRSFLRKLGLAGTEARAVTWTADLIRRGMLVYAGYTEEPADQFTEAVRACLVSWAEELERTVRRLEREASAVVRLLDGRVARKQAAKLLPADGREERIGRYEKHLHSLLTSTLHELERLQARREGEAVPPPAVADVNVTVDT